jgi:hypothetical protein
MLKKRNEKIPESEIDGEKRLDFLVEHTSSNSNKNLVFFTWNSFSLLFIECRDSSY